MTLKEAIAEVKKLHPDKAVCAAKEAWSHSEGSECADYRISILPALNGCACDLFTGKSLEQCIEKLKAETSAFGTPNEE